jgi:hypothetical protein
MAIILVLSGCGNATVAETEISDVELKIKNAITNTRQQDEGSVNLNISGKAETDQEFSFNSKIATDFRLADEVTRLRDIKLSVDLDYVDPNTSEKDTVALSMLLTNNVLFANVLKVPTALQAFPQAQMLIDQWIKFDIPEETLDNQLLLPILKNSKIEGQTETDKAIMDLYNETQFFEAVKFDGKETRNGIKVDSYVVTYSNDAIYNFSVKSAEISGTAMTEEEQLQLKKTLEDMEFSTTFYISDTSLVGIEGELTLYVEEEDASVELEFEADFVELDSSVEFTVPENAIDLMSLLGGLNA